MECSSDTLRGIEILQDNIDSGMLLNLFLLSIQGNKFREFVGKTKLKIHYALFNLGDTGGKTHFIPNFHSNIEEILRDNQLDIHTNKELDIDFIVEETRVYCWKKFSNIPFEKCRGLINSIELKL